MAANQFSPTCMTWLQPVHWLDVVDDEGILKRGDEERVQKGEGGIQGIEGIEGKMG